MVLQSKLSRTILAASQILLALKKEAPVLPLLSSAAVTDLGDPKTGIPGREARTGNV